MAKHIPRAEYLTRTREFAHRGTDLPQTKLNEAKDRLIRSNPDKKTMKQLSLDFGVHVRTIEKVVYFHTWIHVHDD
jgi:hypothetical protein